MMALPNACLERTASTLPEVRPEVAKQFGVSSAEAPAREIKQHRQSPVKVIELEARKLRWVDADAVTSADAIFELIDSADHLSAAMAVDKDTAIEESQEAHTRCALRESERASVAPKQTRFPTLPTRNLPSQVHSRAD
jgi:aminoglycoside phosphotransferase